MSFRSTPASRSFATAGSIIAIMPAARGADDHHPREAEMVEELEHVPRLDAATL